MFQNVPDTYRIAEAWSTSRDFWNGVLDDLEQDLKRAWGRMDSVKAKEKETGRDSAVGIRSLVNQQAAKAIACKELIAMLKRFINLQFPAAYCRMSCSCGCKMQCGSEEKEERRNGVWKGNIVRPDLDQLRHGLN